MAWHHHGSDTPTSARAVLYHTDPNGPNILKGSVYIEINIYKKCNSLYNKSLISKKNG